MISMSAGGAGKSGVFRVALSGAAKNRLCSSTDRVPVFETGGGGSNPPGGTKYGLRSKSAFCPGDSKAGLSRASRRGDRRPALEPISSDGEESSERRILPEAPFQRAHLFAHSPPPSGGVRGFRLFAPPSRRRPCQTASRIREEMRPLPLGIECPSSTTCSHKNDK